MIARIVNYSGTQVGLLAAEPNWDSEIKVSLELPTDVTKEPITLQESRRNFAQTARYKMSWTSYLSNAADATELRIFLTRLRGEGLLVPLWPDVCELQNAIVVGATVFTLADLPVRFGAGWIIATENFATYDIVVVASINTATRVMRLAGSGVTHAYPAGTRLYPLLLGRLDDDRPKPEAITDETLEVELAVRENSAFYGRITPTPTAIQNVGPNIPEFQALPKWNITPNHARPLDWTEMPDVVYEHIGFLREEQQRTYDHRTPRGLELEFLQSDRESAAKIEYLWRDRRATTLRFMIPTYRGDLRMKYDAIPAVIDSYSQTNTNNSAGIYTGARSRLAQSFAVTAQNAGDLIAVKFYMNKVGAPTGTMNARLFSHSGTFGVSSVGNTLLATSTALTVSTALGVPLALVQFNFPTPYTLVAGTNYVLAIEYVGGSASNYVNVGFDDTGNHAGNFSQFTGTWAASAGYDIPFFAYKHGKTIRCERSFFSSPGREAQPGDPYIALINKNDFVSPYQLSRADDVPPDETKLTATSNVAFHEAATTIVSHLLLARFAEATLEWSYTTPYMATTRLKFIELPHEYPRPPQMPHAPPPLQESAYLFIFKEEGIRTDRFTSYENSVQIAGGIYAGTYVPAPFSFDTVREGLKLDQEKLDLKSWKFEGNPLNKMWPFSLDAILTLEIVEVRLNPQDPTQPASNPVTRFYGDIWSVDAEYKATAVPFGNLFDRKFPRFLLSVSDNYTQFSLPTKLPASGFKISGFIHDPTVLEHNSQTVVVFSVLGHAKAADWFSGGWLETGTGVDQEKRSILHSVASMTTGQQICDYYSQTNQSAWGTVYTGLATGVAQSFTGDGHALDLIKFWLKKVGAPTGNMTAKLHAHSGTFGTSSVPGAVIATSVAVPTSVLTTNPAIVTFSFTTHPVLTAGTKYVVSFNYAGGNGANYVAIGTDNTSPSHAGNYSHFTASWAAFPTYDTCFYVYASGNMDAVTLDIDRPLLKARDNQPIDMYPGYDASIDQCETKFNNRINFGGHPFIPNVNPGVKAIKPKETKGGKKG